jgi:hypothetical protein
MYLVCLRSYACIWCIHGYIYAYMSIFNFEMQGLKEKQKKSGKLGGHSVTLPCAYTRQRPHVALTCALGCRVVCCASFFAVRFPGRRTAKPHVWRTAKDPHGRESTHGIESTHGRAGGRTATGMATATSSTHGNACTHGKGAPCTAKILTHGKDIDARQRPLPCIICSAHGKDSVAVRRVAVGSLPRVNARQRRCRVFLALCCAISTHGKDSVSGSDRF